MASSIDFKMLQRDLEGTVLVGFRNEGLETASTSKRGFKNGASKRGIVKSVESKRGIMKKGELATGRERSPAL